jgi:hypothetical protein
MNTNFVPSGPMKNDNREVLVSLRLQEKINKKNHTKTVEG